MAGVTSGRTDLGATVLDNLRKYALAAQESGVEVVVNSVITADNLADIPAIAALCKSLGIRLNIAPAIMENGLPDQRLSSSLERVEYLRLIESLQGEQGLMACPRCRKSWSIAFLAGSSGS
ncbi:hypothetical protein HZA43_04405 [Candidatus Peregrinibacteria bacterium]|nr:hypothetical protein [Candidatus Peregrinibacteria bacterium]